MLPSIKKILYATALGAGSPYVFRYALTMAREHNAEISILHVQEPLSSFAQSLVELHISHKQSEEMHAAARKTTRKTIEQRLTSLCEAEQCQGADGRDLVTEIRTIEGQLAGTILEAAADSGADLIVIGSHRHTALGDALVGSTANKVLHRSTLPVLLVRIPDGYHEGGL